MESPDAAERKWACVAVSNLIQNDPSTRRLLQGKNIVGALITRLSDSEEEVVIEAVGSLRWVDIEPSPSEKTHGCARIGTYASMVAMIYALKCLTSISWLH